MQRKKLPPFDQIQLFFLQVVIAVVVNIYNIFIKYIVFYYEIHLKYCQDTDAYG